MKQRTADHLATANANRDLATTLAGAAGGTPTARYWSVVVAFYAAVHYINAYLRETQGLEPREHGERRRSLAQDAQLQPLAFRYRLLTIDAFDVRYTPNHRLRAAAIRRSLQTMREIEATVTSLL